MNKIFISDETCFYCEKDILHYYDTYDNVYFICYECFKIHEIDWDNKKNSWGKADYGYGDM